MIVILVLETDGIVVLISSVCHLVDEDKRHVLCKLPNGRDWLWGKLGLALVGSEVKRKLLNRVPLFATPWTKQSIQSIEFSMPEYWSE